MPTVVPDQFIELRDRAVDSAFGRCDIPTDIQTLADWFFWESDDAGRDEFDGLFHLSALDFSDENVRDTNDVVDGATITDAMRVECGRRLIERFYENNNESNVYWFHSFVLTNTQGECAHLCIETGPAWQGGCDIDVVGVFLNREDGFKLLLDNCDTFELGTDAKMIDASTILKYWIKD